MLMEHLHQLHLQIMVKCHENSQVTCEGWYAWGFFRSFHFEVQFKCHHYTSIKEAGQGNGVLREVFSLFWKEFSKSHILRKSERVPYIRHDFDCNKWEAVVRILVKGYTESQYFPQNKQSLSCWLSFWEGKHYLWMLQDSFKHYVSPSETSLTEGCLADSITCDNDEMLDFLSAYDCKRKVTHSN